MIKSNERLTRGMTYVPEEDEGFTRGMTYVPEEDEGLTRGMIYVPEEDESLFQSRDSLLKTENKNVEFLGKGGQDIGKASQCSVEIGEAQQSRDIVCTEQRLLRGMYTVDNAFITRPDRESQGVARAFSDGNFGLMLLGVEHEVHDGPDGELQERYYLFQIIMDFQVFMARVRFDELENPDWIKNYTQGEAFIYPEKDARKNFIYYIHYLIKDTMVPETWVYDSTGWRKLKNGEWHYIDACGAVGHQEFPVRCRENLHILTPEMSRISGDYIKESVKMTEICYDKKISTMLFLFFHTGMMTTLFDIAGFPVRFVMGCIGVSNSKKTSLASLMTQLFNREAIRPEVSYMSTKGGLEMAMSKYGDAVLLIDDLMPGSNRQEQSQLQGKLEMVLRAYGDRVAKRRMTLYCRTKEKAFFPVRGCCVMTGEQIAGAYSSMSRILVLSQSSTSVNLEKLSYYQDNPEFLSCYSYGFLQFVADDFERIVKYIKEKIVVLRHKQAFRVPRLSETYAVLAVSAEIIQQYLLKTQKFSVVEINALRKLFEEVIDSVLRENECRLVEQDITVIILSALMESGANGACDFVEKTAYAGSSDAVLYDDTYVYVKLEKLYLVVKEYAAKYDCPIALNDKRQLLNYLGEAGVLESRTTSGGRTENARKMVGMPKNHGRYLYLNRKKIKEKIEQGGI